MPESNDPITRLAAEFDKIIKQKKAQREKEKERPKIKPLGQQIEDRKEEEADEKDKTTALDKEEEDASQDLVDAIEGVVDKIDAPFNLSA